MVLACPFVAVGEAQAGINVWTPIGPEGGSPVTNTAVRVMAFDPRRPDTLYAAIEGPSSMGMNVVYKSTDGGGHWRALKLELTDTYIRFLIIDPVRPDTLYLGVGAIADTFSQMGGLYKSTDGGEHWQRPSGPHFEPTSLVINPVRPDTLYAGDDHGVHKSTDGGSHWKAMLTVGDYEPVYVALDPANPNIVYACTGSGIVSKIDDGGGHWRFMNRGSTFPNHDFIHSLAVDHGHPETLYAITRSRSVFAHSVFKSTDGGGHWQPVNVGLITFISDLIIDPRYPGTLYVAGYPGVYKSTDDGGHWQAVITGLTNTDVNVLAFDPHHPDTLYAGTRGGGIFKITFNK
jgi:photosystem II stability/assembly factor-like uncharacterized protein